MSSSAPANGASPDTCLKMGECASVHHLAVAVIEIWSAQRDTIVHSLRRMVHLLEESCDKHQTPVAHSKFVQLLAFAGLVKATLKTMRQ